MSEQSTSQPGYIEQLRAEVAQSSDRVRQSRLLCELGEVAEREGDEPGAARDYLAAFNADPSFREPLEALVRLLERRRSLKNLGRVIDALVRAAVTPAEKIRALVMRAAFLEDVQSDLDGAKAAAREAIDVETEGGDVPLAASESGAAWLTLELLGAKTQDAALREEALGERAKRAKDPSWKALLLIDVAQVAAARSDVDGALDLFREAREIGGEATFAAAVAAERLVQREPALPGSGDARKRSTAYAEALEAQAAMIAESVNRAESGDALGVPRWARTRAFAADAWLRAADVRQILGENGLAAAALDRAIAMIGTGGDPIAEAALINARMRVAEQMGDTARASALATQRLANESDGPAAAA